MSFSGPQPSAASSTGNQESLESLEAQVRQMISPNLFYRDTGTADQLLRRLEAIYQMDVKSTSKATLWMGLLLLTVVIGIASLVYTIAVSQMGLVLLIPSLILAGILAFLYGNANHLNVPDRRHQLPAKLLRYLKTDIPPDSPLQLEIEFRHYRQSDFETANQGGFFSRIRVTQYEVPWLRLSGQLYDGTKFRLKVIQCVKRKTKQKRKRAKLTETVRDKYQLTLAVKPGRYPGLERLPSLLPMAPRSPVLFLPTAQVSGNRININAVTQPHRLVNNTEQDLVTNTSILPGLHMFVAAYHCLGQCRNA